LTGLPALVAESPSHSHRMSIYSVNYTTCFHIKVPEGETLAPEKHLDFFQWRESCEFNSSEGAWQMPAKPPAKGDGSWHLNPETQSCYLFRTDRWWRLDVDFTEEQAPPVKTDIEVDDKYDETCDSCLRPPEEGTVLEQATLEGVTADYCAKCIERAEEEEEDEDEQYEQKWRMLGSVPITKAGVKSEDDEWEDVYAVSVGVDDYLYTDKTRTHIPAHEKFHSRHGIVRYLRTSPADSPTEYGYWILANDEVYAVKRNGTDPFVGTLLPGKKAITSEEGPPRVKVC